MVDILKITSPVTTKNKVENLPKNLPKDLVFDITTPLAGEKSNVKAVQQESESTKQTILKNATKESLAPIFRETGIEAETLKNLVGLFKVDKIAAQALPKDFLAQFFVEPEQLLPELLARDKQGTIFRGDFFDSLRMLIKMPEQKEMKASIVALLKSFDCFVKQDGAIQAVLQESENLVQKLPAKEGKLLQEKLNQLTSFVRGEEKPHEKISSFIKNEYVPSLITLAKHHSGNRKVYDGVMSVIHHVIRLDQADPKLLEESIRVFGEELSRISSLSPEESEEIQKLVLLQAKELKEEFQKTGFERSPLQEEKNIKEEFPVLQLLSMTLEKSESTKVTGVAHQLLQYMLHAESPLLPYTHFTLPIKFQETDTFVEFFMDKECKKRRGEAKAATNIFFTIESEEFGSFAVDLLAKDRFLEVEINVPEIFRDKVLSYKKELAQSMEDQGYRLAGYKVGVYQGYNSILKKFPSLADRKAGIDVKV